MAANAPARASARMRRKARVQLSWAYMQLARYAHAQVATSTDPLAGPGDFITVSERIQAVSIDISFLSTIVECSRGVPWRSIAQARHMTMRETVDFYGEMYELWLDGDSYPWWPPGITNALTCCPEDIDVAAEEMDRWFRDTLLVDHARAHLGEHAVPVGQLDMLGDHPVLAGLPMEQHDDDEASGPLCDRET